MLADDHTLFRQGIRTLISAEADMEVVGEAANGTDAVTRAAETRPDVVLMDIGMTGMSSFKKPANKIPLRAVGRLAPRARCVMY